MPERPVNNLPPGSQPWAREIAGAIDAAQFDAIKANMNNKNAFKTINATLDQLARQQLQIIEQQEYLAGLQTVVNEVGSFSDIITNTNGSWTWLGSTASVTVAVPTGRALVMVHCPNMEAIVNDFATMYYGVGYSLTGSSSGEVRSYAAGFGESSSYNMKYASPITLVDVVEVTPGTHTFTASREYFGIGLASNARLSAGQLRLVVQVVENS